MIKRSLSLAVLALMVTVGTAQAQTQSLGDYDGPEFTTGFPLPGVSLGIFTTGTGVTSATIHGTWGTAAFPSTTAGLDLFLDGILVASCAEFEVGCYESAPAFAPWSYTFSGAELSIFADGAAELIAVQTSPFRMRIGDPTLDWTASVPEPASVFLLASGVLGLAVVARRREDD